MLDTYKIINQGIHTYKIMSKVACNGSYSKKYAHTPGQESIRLFHSTFLVVGVPLVKSSRDGVCAKCSCAAYNPGLSSHRFNAFDAHR